MSPRGCRWSSHTLEVCAGEDLGCGSLNSRETPEFLRGEEEKEKILVRKGEEQRDEENEGIKPLKSIFSGPILGSLPETEATAPAASPS